MRSGLFVFLILLSSYLTAQEKCGTKVPTSGAFENWLSAKISAKKNLAKSPEATIYQIPVVVHVFHNGESVGTGPNLSDDRIKAQIDSLTADFRRMNADAVNTPTEFLPVAADIEIEFILARQDPLGNPTNGIVRVRGENSNYLPTSRSSQLSLRSQSFWNPENYLNIYVADLRDPYLGLAIFPDTDLPGGILDFDRDYIDCIFIDYQYFGVNFDTPTFDSYGRTLTHEIGHFFGLRHIWGDGNSCSTDDFVDDTPLANTDNGGYTSPCTFPNPDDAVVCVEGEPEMFQNYMDYTDDVCMNLFTAGQKTRMRTVIDNAPLRSTLISSPALNDPTSFLNDLAAVNVLSPFQVECGASISPALRVENHGTNEITSYDVQFFLNGNPQGSPQSVVTSLSPLSADTVFFPNLTINTVPATLSFEISNVNGTTDGNLSNNVIDLNLIANSSQILPFTEDFEGSQQIVGTIGSSSPWEKVNAPKSSPSNQGLVFKAHENNQWFGETTILKTPILDLGGISSGDLQFSYAHANPPDHFNDGLMVKVSLDCGETFSEVLFSSFGPNLATASETNSYFTPANQLEWIDTVLSITDYRDIDGVQFAFTGLNGGGNNIYLDDIRVVETNLFENDVKAINLNGPLITCAESSAIELRIRNVGSQVITSFEVAYEVNGVSAIRMFTGLDISSKSYASFDLQADDLQAGNNTISAVITQVNGVADESTIDNSLEATLSRDTKSDEYPLTVDFESADNWDITSAGSEPLWTRANLPSNGVLKAEGYNTPLLGQRSWFVSPKLNTGNLDSAGLYFRASYASRDGFNDRLQVLLSTDCGESYSTTLLDADADSLSVATVTDKWTPLTDEDWKEYRLDLTHSFFFDKNIRIAFVFTPGGGNDLFIDDISIRANEPQSYEDVVRTYPNPAVSSFNVGLNLPQKESVTIRLMDVSGRVIFEESIENALNQILEYKAPSQEGLYFINVKGSQFNTTQKLFISR